MKPRLVASALMVTAIALAVGFGLTRSARHEGTVTVTPSPLQLNVADFLRRPLFDERVFLNGFLVPGTLCRVSDPCELRFHVTDRAAGDSAARAARGHTLAVSFPSCLIPRPMRNESGADVEVIVGGQVCATCHDFQASDVLARARTEAPPPAPLGSLPDSLEAIPLCSAP